MDSPFKDLDEFLSPALELPVGGRTYAIAPSADLVLRLRRFYHKPGGDDDQGLALGAELLGATYDPETTIITGAPESPWTQMESDGVSGQRLLRVAQTAMIWFGMSSELAQRFWETGSIANPKELESLAEKALEVAAAAATPPNRKTRRATTKKPGSKAPTATTTPAPEPTE